MLKTKVNDLVVYYTEDDDIETIIRIIKNNYDFLFKDYVDNGFSFSTLPRDGDDKCIHTDDFQKDTTNMIEQYYYHKGDACLSEPENLSALYIALLLQMSGVKNPFFDFDFEESAEILDTVIAKQYYLANGNVDQFVEYAKYRDPEETKKFYFWLRETCRYESYNYVLGRISEFLNANGFDYLSSTTSNDIFIDVIKSYNERQEKEYNLPKMNPEEIDRLFYDFLNYIHAPESWRKIYNAVKRRNGISYKVDESKIVSYCYKDEKDEDYSINIEYNGTITGFCCLVHEFIHYLSFYNEKFNFSLAEFPSIYFEKIAANFLKERGYSSEVVDETIASRNTNNIEILTSLSTIFIDINNFMKKGPITRDEKIELWQKQILGVYNLRKKHQEELKAQGEKVNDLEPLPSMEEIAHDVDEDCDESINQFIIDDLFILDGYQYLLGTSLAESILRKEGKESIRGMIEIVGDLPYYDANSVIEKFGIERDSVKEKNKTKIKDINY